MRAISILLDFVMVHGSYGVFRRKSRLRRLQRLKTADMGPLDAADPLIVPPGSTLQLEGRPGARDPKKQIVNRRGANLSFRSGPQSRGQGLATCDDSRYR
jgi:hypothetical protein